MKTPNEPPRSHFHLHLYNCLFHYPCCDAHRLDEILRFSPNPNFFMPATDSHSAMDKQSASTLAQWADMTIFNKSAARPDINCGEDDCINLHSSTAYTALIQPSAISYQSPSSLSTQAPSLLSRIQTHPDSCQPSLISRLEPIKPNLSLLSRISPRKCRCLEKNLVPSLLALRLMLQEPEISNNPEKLLKVLSLIRQQDPTLTFQMDL